ncbi:MAG: twin-arginine translocase subunit TatC, partial [Flavobacteriaceae bacterium]|nr:twin-arginine translocase subunit TatC [Flavobacteriaceae bacterium]
MFTELRPHLVELRKRLGLSVLSIFIGFIIAFVFHEIILEWITAPLNEALAQVAHLSKKAADGMVTTHQVGGAFF